MKLNSTHQKTLDDFLASYRAITGLKKRLLDWLLPKWVKEELNRIAEVVNSPEEEATRSSMRFTITVSRFRNLNPFLRWNVPLFNKLTPWFINLLFPTLHAFTRSALIREYDFAVRWVEYIYPYQISGSTEHDARDSVAAIDMMDLMCAHPTFSNFSEILPRLQELLDKSKLEPQKNNRLKARLNHLVITDPRPDEAVDILLEVARSIGDDFFSEVDWSIELNALSILSLQCKAAALKDPEKLYEDGGSFGWLTTIAVDYSRDPFVSKYFPRNPCASHLMNVLIDLRRDASITRYPIVVDHIVNSQFPESTYKGWQNKINNNNGCTDYGVLIEFVESSRVSEQNKQKYLQKIFDATNVGMACPSILALPVQLCTADNLDKYFEHFNVFIAAGNAFLENNNAMHLRRIMAQSHLDAMFALCEGEDPVKHLKDYVSGKPLPLEKGAYQPLLGRGRHSGVSSTPPLHNEVQRDDESFRFQ